MSKGLGPFMQSYLADKAPSFKKLPKQIPAAREIHRQAH